ncbi:MAG: hypothetical protein CBD27_11905 [Rhodospirillaceae bacterium TMED167]|nr:hypothetical protein [Rhodospirillaceae bacterium]OUW23824.1 MAG: hypothetical protein CBD27_11905 [Rhodospirillaceae bacterium TMED167]
MNMYLELIFVSPGQIVPLLIGIVLWIGLASVGTLVTPKDRLTEANIFYGWAVISAVFTLVGVLIRGPFFVIFIIAAFAALLGIYLVVKRGQDLFVPGWWKVIILAIPLFWIAGAMDPSQWDEFSHWLPAPKYLLAFDGFPNAEKPYDGPQMLSAYPYGWPFLSYLSGRIAGGPISNMGAALNLLLLLTMTSYVLRSAYQMAGRPVRPEITWGFAAAAILCATLFNPTFIQKIILTAYSDVSTAVTVGVVLLTGYHYLEALAGRGRGSSWSGAWQLALLFSLLINLRQTNVVLFVILIISIGMLAFLDGKTRLANYLKQLPFIVMPALIVYLAWRFHVSSELAEVVGAESSLQPFAQWHVAEIPLILKQMMVVAWKKIAFFGSMAIAVFFSVRAFSDPVPKLSRIALLCALGFLGYNAFLLLIYVGHFDLARALNVVSFWRYNTHVGMLGVIFIVTAAVFFWVHKKGEIRVAPKFRLGAIILALILPLAFAPKLRFDLEPPKPHFTAVAKSLKGSIPEAARMFIIDPTGTGEAGVITRYHLNKFGAGWLAALHNTTVKNIKRYVTGVTESDFILLHSVTQNVRTALDLQPDPRQSHLLKRDGKKWKIIRSWDKPANHPY